MSRYHYEAIPARQLQRITDMVCIPGNGTMIEALTLAVAANQEAVDVEKNFIVREAPYFSNVEKFHEMWVVKRHEVVKTARTRIPDPPLSKTEEGGLF